MYYGKKKGIIIAIVVILIVVLLAIAGIIVYAKTDLFKSNKSLFWKYAGAQIEEVKKISPEQIANIEKAKNEKPYTTSGELTFDSDNTEASKILNKIKVGTEGQADPTDSYNHTYTKLDYDGKKLFDFHYINSDNIFALKAEEIITVYLGFKNENLNVLAQKLGIPSSDVPDELPIVANSELFNLSENQLSYISETYKDLIVKNIPNENYSKQTSAVINVDNSSYKTTSYRLDLSAKELSTITKEVLTKMKTDSVVLDLLATKFSLMSMDQYNSVDGVKNLIDNVLNNLSDDNFKDISFVVYKHEGKTIATEIIVKNELKITINTGVGKLKVSLEDLKGEQQFEKLDFNFEYSFAATSSQIKLLIKLNDEELVDILATIIGSPAQSKIQTDVTASINVKGKNTNTNTNTTSSTYGNTIVTSNDDINNVNVNDTTNSMINSIEDEDNNTISTNSNNSVSSLLSSSNTIDDDLDEDDALEAEEENEANKIELAYTEIIEFVEEIENKEKLDQTNCAVLNDYSQEQISGLIQAIYARTLVVLQEKAQIFGNLFGSSVDSMARVDFSDSTYKSMNETAKTYIGKNKTASIARNLCELVLRNNQDSSNQVVKINGVSDTTEINNLKDTFVDASKYDISAEYNDSGIINAFTIMKVD